MELYGLPPKPLDQGIPSFPTKKQGEEGLMEACEEFESIFVNEIFKAMRRTVPHGELIPRGMAEDIFESMLDEEIARKSSKTNDFGLSRILYEQLSSQGPGA